MFAAWLNHVDAKAINTYDMLVRENGRAFVRHNLGFGNAGRNTVYGPGMQTMDLALVRSFALADKLHLDMRAEAFNASNTRNLRCRTRPASPTSSASSAARRIPPGDCNLV